MSYPERVVTGARRLAFSLAFGALLGLGWGTVHAAPPADPGASGASGASEVEAPEPPPSWRFRDADRPVKVVLLAGSIGAWQKDPYIEHFERMCPRIEVHNLSKVGQGAYALKQRFRDQVIENRWLDFRDDTIEWWLVYQGGLNSVGMPEKTNRFIRDTFVLAHRRGFRIVGLSLTPWGADSDGKRWREAPDALRYLRATQKIVDFVVGRLAPREALGAQVERRDDPRAPWSADELADVGIDLYDGSLRDSSAPLRDEAKVRSELERDRSYQRSLAELPAEARAARFEADIRLAREVPRWFMRESLRAFDHIHPNADGHAAIAELACPQLPRSWGCSCPSSGLDAAPDPDAAGPDPRNPYF